MSLPNGIFYNKGVITMADWYCPNCDFKNRDTNKTCTSCGTARPNTAPPKPEAPSSNTVNASVWTCPKCNHINSTNTSTCYSCGTSRYGGSSQQNISGMRISGKKALICIAVATVVVVGAAAKGMIGYDARSSSRRHTSSVATTAVTTAVPVTTKKAEEQTTAKEKGTVAKPSASSKPSALIEYAAEQNNISIDSISEMVATDDGKYMLMVYVNTSSNLTSKLAVRSMHNDICDLIEPLQNCGKVDTITFFMQGDFIDSYGNKSTDTAMRVNLSADTIDKIDFSSQYWDSSNITDIADGYWVHKSLQD